MLRGTVNVNAALGGGDHHGLSACYVSVAFERRVANAGFAMVFGFASGSWDARARRTQPFASVRR